MVGTRDHAVEFMLLDKPRAYVVFYEVRELRHARHLPDAEACFQSAHFSVCTCVARALFQTLIDIRFETWFVDMDGEEVGKDFQMLPPEFKALE